MIFLYKWMVVCPPTSINWFFMYHFVQVNVSVLNVPEVPQLDSTVYRWCRHQPVTARVKLCMGHFSLVQLSIVNLFKTAETFWWHSEECSVPQTSPIRYSRVSFIYVATHACFSPDVHPVQAEAPFLHCLQSQASGGLPTHPHSSTSNCKRLGDLKTPHI